MNSLSLFCHPLFFFLILFKCPYTLSLSSYTSVFLFILFILFYFPLLSSTPPSPLCSSHSTLPPKLPITPFLDPQSPPPPALMGKDVEQKAICGGISPLPQHRGSQSSDRHDRGRFHRHRATAPPLSPATPSPADLVQGRRRRDYRRRVLGLSSRVAQLTLPLQTFVA